MVAVVVAALSVVVVVFVLPDVVALPDVVVPSATVRGVPCWLLVTGIFAVQ